MGTMERQQSWKDICITCIQQRIHNQKHLKNFHKPVRLEQIIFLAVKSLEEAFHERDYPNSQ